MNKTININVGSLPFIIDDEAYFELEIYLTSLEKHFKNSEGFEEIISDIEARIAELFHERLGNRTIVRSEDVQYAISVMGTPNEMEEPLYDESKESSDKWSVQTGKRLFRDGDDKVVGGVCSGLAAYFGISDPVWIRILFAVLFFSMGFGLIPYIIMWAIIPEAATAGERLAMKGEQINVNNIAKTIEDGFGSLSESLQDIGDGIRGKKKRKNTKEDRNAFSGGIPLLDDDDVHLSEHSYSNSFNSNNGSRFQKLFKGTFIFLAIGIVAFLFIVFLGSVVGALALGHASSFILPWDGVWGYTLSLFAFLVISLPILSFIYRIARGINPTKFRGYKKLRFSTRALSILGVVAFFAILSITGRQFKNSNSISSELLSFEASSNPVTIKLASPFEKNTFVKSDYFGLGRNHIAIKHSEKIILTKSPDNNWHLLSKVSSRGYDDQSSIESAKKVELDYSFDESVLSIGNGFRINKQGKYRGQTIRYEIQIPEGAIVDFDRSALFKVECEAFPDHDLHKELLGKTFKMKNEKLQLAPDEKGLLGEM